MIEFFFFHQINITKYGCDHLISVTGFTKQHRRIYKGSKYAKKSIFSFYLHKYTMASSILRRTFVTQSKLKIGLIPADGIGREGKNQIYSR